MFISLKHISLKAIALGFIATVSIAHAEPLLAVGNLMVKPKALENIIRESVATQLGAHISNNTLSILVPEIKEIITTPATTGLLQTILTTLGISNQFPLSISPVRADFALPTSAFDIRIQNKSSNQFAISAKLSLTSLSAQTDTLSIQLPETIFNQNASVASSGVKIALAEGSPTVQMEIDLIATLKASGTTFKVQGFHTNLNDANPPQFALTLGQLTINNVPLTLQISQGPSAPALSASEPEIRAELQKLESSYLESMRVQIASLLTAAVSGMAESVQDQPALKFDMKSDEIVAQAGIPDKNLQAVLGGVELTGVLSYLQTVRSANVYSAQISSPVCLDNSCIASSTKATQIGAADLKLIQPNDDGAAILYESFLQDIVNAPQFQNRIQKLYQAAGTTPGVDLGTAGLKVFLDPLNDSIVAILNLEITIKKTAASGFSAIFQRDAGSLIEKAFGSGKVILMPVTVNIKFAGVEKDNGGVDNLVLDFSLPSFADDGSFVASPLCSASVCPNNVPNMTPEVRSAFLSQVKEQISKVVPPQKKVPLSATTYSGMSFQMHNLNITPNHGLLITAGLSAVATEGASKP